MKKHLVILILISITGSYQSAFAQKIIPKFIRKMYFEKDSSKRGSFVVLPVLSSAPETGLEIGGAGLYSFYSDTINHETRVSNIYGYATITTKGQNRINLSTSYWAPKNKYFYAAGINYVNFPANFYGIGNNTRKADANLLGEKRYRLTLEAEKRFGKNLYIGFVAGGYSFDYNNKEPGGIFDTGTGIEDKNGGKLVYIGPSFIYDSRNNNTYTTRGFIITAHLNAMQGLLSNNSYQGGFFNIEYAQFFSLSKRFVLGLNAQEQSLLGNRSPFYLLPELGSDELMRGYYNGRYRDRNLIAAQAELRYRINDRFGLAGFIGAGEVSHSSFSIAELKPNFGGGFRYFFDVEKGLSVRVDYGMGQKPAGEKRESGFYIGLGQAF